MLGHIYEQRYFIELQCGGHIYLVSTTPADLACKTSSTWFYCDPITDFVSLDFGAHL
jgi:hypothetical protein